MKRQMLSIAAALVLLLTACSQQRGPAGGAEGPEAHAVTVLDAGVWPENEYTAGLPVPPGTVETAMLDTEHQNCWISMVGMDERAYEDYLALLAQEGFSVVEEVTEKIRGQEYMSSGLLLSDGEKALSISYIPDRFGLYISFAVDG